MDPYDRTISEFNDEFNVITGLVNLDLLWDKIDRDPPPQGRWETVMDWNRAALLQAALCSDRIRSTLRCRDGVHELLRIPTKRVQHRAFW